MSVPDWMDGMRRILRIFWLAFWPLLCVGVAGFWIGSYWTPTPWLPDPLPEPMPTPPFSKPATQIFTIEPRVLQSSSGTIAYLIKVDHARHPGTVWKEWKPFPSKGILRSGMFDQSGLLEPGYTQSRFILWGFAVENVVTETTYSYFYARHGIRRYPDDFEFATRLVVSYWLICFICAVATVLAHRRKLVWLLRLLLKGRRGRRIAAGLCANCGYDLRATPWRCPECGAEPAAGKLHYRHEHKSIDLS